MIWSNYGFRLLLLIILIAPFNQAKSTTLCTKIISKSDVNLSSSIPRFESVNAALAKYKAGDSFCLADRDADSFTISDFDSGASPLTIRALHNLGTVITNRSYKGTGIRILNSSGIIIDGLIITGGLFGIKIEDSSNIKLLSNLVYHVGNEAILVKPKIKGGRNFLIKGNTIFNTGNLHPRYGEGVYIGDGTYNEDKTGLKVKKTISNVLITNNAIYDTSNEAIDIKSNAYNVRIEGNYINDVDLMFNAAITVATEASYASAGGYHIENNVISRVNNRSGYRPIGIAVGHGDATVINNVVVESAKNLIAICLFTTFLNQQLNKVTLINNKLIGKGTLLSKKCSGGTKVKAQAIVEVR